MALPETIKVAKCGYPAGVPAGPGLTYIPVPVQMGPQEVALLHALQWIIATAAPNADSLQSVLWRKSLPAQKANLLTTWREDTDVIDYYATENYWGSDVGYGDPYKQIYKVLPRPLLLIRPPQLVAVSATANTSVNLWLWYTVITVTDEELARLMIKDHA